MGSSFQGMRVEGTMPGRDCSRPETGTGGGSVSDVDQVEVVGRVLLAGPAGSRGPEAGLEEQGQQVPVGRVPQPRGLEEQDRALDEQVVVRLGPELQETEQGVVAA